MGKKINDIYKIINYEMKKSDLFCMVEKDEYILVRDCGWGLVGSEFMSSSNPIEFIASQNRAVNIKTSSGINEIKRIYRRNLPTLVKEYLDTKILKSE